MTWRAGRTLLFILGLALLGNGCVGLQGVLPKRGTAYEAEVQSWKNAVKERGGNGMWIVVRSYTNAGDLFAITTNSRFSHACVLDANGSTIIESVFKGVVESPLDQLIDHAHRVVLVEPPGWTPETGNAALARAKLLAGKKFDFGGLFGLPHTQRWYCSEVALHAWELRTDRIGPWNVTHPAWFTRRGRILFDSGPRDGVPDP